MNYYRKKGLKFLKRGKAEKAVVLFEKILQYSQTPEDIFNYAISLMDIYNYDAAIENFIRVREQDKDYLMNNLALGEAYLLTRNWEKAEEIFTELSQKYPEQKTFKNYLLILGDVVKREKYVTVKKKLEEAVKALKKGDNIKAIEHLEFAKQVAPELPNVRNSLGEIYFMIKDYDKAFEYFKQAIKMEPDNPRFQKNWRKILKYKK